MQHGAWGSGRMAMARRSRRVVAAVSVVALLAVVTVLARAATVEEARPNFVVVMTDDQTVESMRVLSGTNRLLAEQGTTFTNAMTSFPLCCPSRATFLTGQYAHNHGVLGNKPPFGGYGRLDHTNTLPVWLQESGYHTTHIGKYLNGYGSTGREKTEVPPGWDDWQATVGGTAYRMYDYTINDNGALRQYGDAPSDYQTDVLAGRAVEAIRERAAADQPFFLWIAPLAPHGEVLKDAVDPDAESADDGVRPAPRHEGAFADEPLPKPPSYDEADVSDKPAHIAGLSRITPEQEEALTRRYREELESLLAVDDLVEAVVAALEEGDLLRNTVVVFTSDNGYFHGEHRIKEGKFRLYEESARAPLVVRGPGFPAGSRQGMVTSNVDLAATVVDMAGASPGRRLDGRSLEELVGDPDAAATADRAVLLEVAARKTGALPERGIRTARYTYIERSQGDGRMSAELYDLEEDPFQLESQHDNPDYAAVRKELSERLEVLRTCSGDTCQVTLPRAP